MKKLQKILFLLILPFVVLVAGYGIYKLFLIPPPVVKGLDAFTALPIKKEIMLETENLRELKISIQQGPKLFDILKQQYERPPETVKILIEPKKIGLKDGTARVIVKMKSGLLKKEQKIIDTIIDTVPPEIHVLYAPFSLRTGEAGPVILKVKDADRVYVRLRDHIYQLFRFSDNRYVGLVPVNIRTSSDGVFYAVAEDKAGNSTVQALRTRIKKKKFRTSTIRIKDDFIKKVVLPLLGKTSTSDPVADFREVNEQWRTRNEEQLRQIGKRSSEVFYVKGKFLQLKNSKVMARYGEHRKYFYKGHPISESYHLGYDLASIARAPVGAANRGKVVFAGNLGIYGNTVIIDHGLGLMSLYGHLSEILVKEGQMVRRGQIIGRTGQTGLAAGDHLHFSILVQGEEVSPLYWWDAKWIKLHIKEPLNEGF